jgi:hypothetical protein
MKIRPFNNSRLHGNILIVTVCVTAILGLALAGYLTLASNQNQLTAHSQVWNSAMPVVEAGIEEALTHLTKNYVTNMESCGWVLSGNQYVKSNLIGDGYYRVTISQGPHYEIIATGYAPMPGSSTYVSRTVDVVTQNKGVFAGALIVRSGIDLKGNNVLADSYDSRDPSKSTNGKYDPAKAGDHGDVTCLNGLANVGNANVWGHALTGPGITPSTGPNGAIGSVAWQKAGYSGVQPGWSQDDFNVSFPDVSAPFPAAVPPMPGTYNGTNFDSVLGNGNYLATSLSGKVLVYGNTTLYVTGNISFKSGDLLQIAPGASLKLYMGGASATFQTIVNPNDSATNFLYYGLPSNTSISMNGNAHLTAAIYAPEASFTLNGSAEISGAVMANNASMTGNSAIHYDEALLIQLPTRGFIINSWNEL